MVPGTVHLVDIEGSLRAKHALGGQKDVVLIPAPSDDPDDPLNWSAKRKLLSTTCISMCVCHLLLCQSLTLLTSYTFAVGTAASAIYSILEPIEKSTSLTLSDLNAGTGYMVGEFCVCGRSMLNNPQFLLFGLGCLFWQPLALQYGKRPVYLISMLATTVSPTPTWFPSSLKLMRYYRLLRYGCPIRIPMVNGSPASCYKGFLGLQSNLCVRYR